MTVEACFAGFVCFAIGTIFGILWPSLATPTPKRNKTFTTTHRVRDECTGVYRYIETEHEYPEPWFDRMPPG